MTLTQRTFLTVVSTFIALFFILATLSDVILLKSFAKLEQIVVTDNVEKVKSHIERSFEELTSSLNEVADIDPVRLPSRLKTLPDSFLLNRHVDFVVYFSSERKLTASRVAKDKKKSGSAAVNNLSDALGEIIPLVNKNPYGLLNGLILVNGVPVHIAAETLPGTGATLFAGRFIDEEEVKRFTAHTDFKLELVPVEGDGEGLSEVRAEVARGRDSAVVITDSDTVCGYSLMKDVFGQPALFVKISEERLLYKQGIASIVYVLVSLVVVGFVFCGVMLFFIRETVLDRLKSLTEKLSHITTQGDISRRLPLSSNEDELKWLALSVNSMLDSLENAENDVRDSEERYRRLFDRAPDAIFIVGIEGNEAGRIVAANQSAAEQHGYSIDELLNMQVFDLNTAESNKVAGPLIKSIAAGEWTTAELWHRKKDGTTFPVEVHAGLIKINGKNYVLGFDRDITQRKITEEADQIYLERIRQLNDELSRNALSLAAANNELEAFNYSVSHDMRGPLTRISGYCQLLLEDDSSLSPEAREYVNQIYESEIWLNDMIDSLLNLSQLSRAELESQRVDLSALVETTLKDLAVENPGRQIRTVVEPNVFATGDSRLLKTVLVNLVGNAWKYSSHKDDALIEFGVKQAEAERVYYVRDNGAGFAMANADKLFRVFTRLHDSSRFSGIGIGLATVQRIILRHGGKIWAEAEPEVGATFYFTLP